jgi:hypothetical protein
MACLQTSAGNGGPGIRPTYATEAACLEACKEGACCEGTTCSVKPQCQCQGAGKTFNGVGTVCSPNPCLRCNADGTPKTQDTSRCHCFCGELGYPRFMNISVEVSYILKRNVYTKSGIGGYSRTGSESKSKSLSASLTLSILPQAAIASPWTPVFNAAQYQTDCPLWRYGEINSFLAFANGVRGCIDINTIYLTSTTVRWFYLGYFIDDTEWQLPDYASGANIVKSGWGTNPTDLAPQALSFNSPAPSAESAGPYTSPPCFSGFAGMSLSGYGDVNVTSHTSTVTISGVQA